MPVPPRHCRHSGCQWGSERSAAAAHDMMIKHLREIFQCTPCAPRKFQFNSNDEMPTGMGSKLF